MLCPTTYLHIPKVCVYFYVFDHSFVGIEIKPRVSPPARLMLSKLNESAANSFTLVFWKNSDIVQPDFIDVGHEYNQADYYLPIRFRYKCPFSVCQGSIISVHWSR